MIETATVVRMDTPALREASRAVFAALVAEQQTPESDPRWWLRHLNLCALVLLYGVLLAETERAKA